MDVGEFLKSRKILCDCFCATWLFWWIVFFLFVFSAAYNKWNQSEVKITQFLSRSLESRRRLKFDAGVGSRSGRSQPLHHSEKISSLGSWISQRKGFLYFGSLLDIHRQSSTLQARRAIVSPEGRTKAQIKAKRPELVLSMAGKLQSSDLFAAEPTARV